MPVWKSRRKKLGNRLRVSAICLARLVVEKQRLILCPISTTNLSLGIDRKLLLSPCFPGRELSTFWINHTWTRVLGRRSRGKSWKEGLAQLLMLQRPPSLSLVTLKITDMQAEDDVPTPKYHPLFDSPGADAVLGSKDGILFRVHSHTLKTTSGWFNSMFSLPQKEEPSDPDAATTQVTVYLDEESIVLEALFRCVCGLAIPQLDSYDIIEPFLYAAEKYDMPGPLSIVRALVMTPPLLEDPLRLFVIACRYGWEDTAQLAATKTLTIDIFHSSIRPTLKKLNSLPLLSLIDLHRGRRDLLKQRLNEPPFVSDSGPSSCSHCGSPVDYHTWRELKHAIIMEMDVRPLGDTICELNMVDWPQGRSFWEAKCATCSRVLYDKKETMIAIRSSIDGLPQTLESSFVQTMAST